MGAEGIGLCREEVFRSEPKSTMWIVLAVEVVVSLLHIIPGSIRVLLR